MSDQNLATRLENRLMSHGIYVQRFEVTDGGYAVEYESLAADDGVIPHREVGRVINVFRDLLDDGVGVDIEAVVTDLDGNPQGSWHVEQDWLEALEAEELSEVDFSARVIETLGD